MTERNYYRKFKESLDLPLLKYFSKLDFEDWFDFFNDYYRHELTFLLRILDTPKGEDIYSYGLIWVNNVDSSTRELITRSNDKLLSVFITENNTELLDEIFKTIIYLKLDVTKDFLFQIISDKKRTQKIREQAALTLITVYENSTSTFWDNIDLEQDSFLIPSYIAYQRTNNPVRGLEKLKLINERPENIAVFEIPILYSLLQVSTSSSCVEEYKILQHKLPTWATTFIKELFDDYPELDTLKEKIQRPYEDVLEKIGLDNSVWDDLESENLSIAIKNSVRILKSSFNILLKELKDKPELIEVVNQKEVTIIDPSYIHQLDSIFIGLKTKLKKMGIVNKKDPSNEQVFEATENIFLYDQPVIFLYPYFLDDYRMNKRGAGVIQYADQKSMSMVIHKQNHLYFKWGALREEAEETLRKEGHGSRHENTVLDRSIPEQKSASWLVELIQHLYKQNGKIYSIRGYVFDSLIQQFAKKWIPTNENKKMIEVLRNSTDIGNINKELPFYRMHGAKETICKNEILLLDPADALKESKNGKSKELSELNTDYYDIITVQHGLEISVGIGFSLFALPRLLKNKNWKTLQNLVVEKLQSEKKLMMRVGIRVFDLETKTVNKQNKVIV